MPERSDVLHRTFSDDVGLEPLEAESHLPAVRQRVDHAVDVAFLHDLAHRPAVIDIIDPEQTHDLAVAVCAEHPVVRLSPLDERLHERRAHRLARERGDEIRRTVGTALREIRREHAIDIELVGVAQHLREHECLRVIGLRDRLFVVIPDREAHKRAVAVSEAHEERQLREHLECELSVVLRLRVTERLVKAVLPEPADIVKQPHDLRELPLVRREPQMTRERHHVRRHIARMCLLDENALHDFLVRRVERLHIRRHPGVHFP